MSVISAHRLKQVRGLVSALPDGALRSLDGALSLTHDPALTEVRQLIVDERERRQIKSVVFAPYMPLFEVRADDLNSVIFPNWLLDNCWWQLQIHEPELMAEALHAARGFSRNDPVPVVFFRLVTAAAERLRSHPEEVLPRNPKKGDAAEVSEFAEYLEMHRIVRDALSRLPDWMGRIDADRAATLRLLYKDACEKSEDNGARFMEVLFTNLDDGVQIMKLIAAVVDKSNDRFLAESELADFGERVLERIDEQVVSLRKSLEKAFRPEDDPHDAGRCVAHCLGLMYTFEQAIELSREGPWGLRIGLAHKAVAALVETRLKQVEKLVAQALPTKPSRGGLPRPRLDKPPAALDLGKARASLIFMADVRNHAQHGGYASLHTKTVQGLEMWLSSYFEDLLAEANADEPPAMETLDVFFNALIDLVEAGLGDERASLVRRRIASSALYRGTEDSGPDQARA